MRAAIYARYSSANQRDASIEDQVRICKAHLERESWSLVGTYTDHAMSGATTLRPGYQKLLEDARAGSFDIVLAEGLDRLSRDQEDIAGLYKQLSFAGIKIVTLAEGEISELHVGLKGTMNALYLKDLAQKTRRGLEGRVRAGRSAGGLCYGYNVVDEYDGRGDRVHGGRRINPAQADIVVRIFEEFTSGMSPRAIAKQLNGESTTGPRGGTWAPSTIYGNWRRGTGVLNNEMYIGRLVWNRQTFVKDPSTGRRQARLNPPNEWIIENVPDLRIVSVDLWQAVKGRQKTARRTIAQDNGIRSERARRPAYLLSGLIKCGVCGGGFSIIREKTYGCSAAKNKATCSNRATIKREILEECVLAGLKENLMEPDLVKEFVSEYHRELNRLNSSAEQEVDRARRALDKIDREMDRLVQAIKDGVKASRVVEELDALEEKKVELTAKVRQAPARAPLLHPNLAEVYRKKVENLREVLDDDDTRPEATSILRDLVDEIRLHPEENALKIELIGDLARILSFANQNPRRNKTAGVEITLVAGGGFEPPTFRL